MVYRRRRVARRPRKAKRWQFSAQIGKNVPLLGGTGIRFGTRAVRNIARSEIARQAELKQYPFSLTSDRLIHNVVYTMSPLQAISSGIGPDAREGNEIFIKHVAFKFLIKNQSQGVAQPIVKFRVLGLWMEQDYITGGPVTLTSGQVNPTDVFMPSTSWLNAMIDNKKGVHIICDKTMTVSPPASAFVVVRQFKLDCPINKKVTYKNADNIFKDRQLYWIVIPYSTVPTTTGTPIGTVGSLDIQGVVTYRDL